MADWTYTHTPSWTRSLLGAKPHTSSTKWVFRGHQHEWNGDTQTMKQLIACNGIAQAWHDNQPQDEQQLLPDRAFYTLQTGPDNPFLAQSYGLKYDTCIEVTVGTKSNNWLLRKINVQTIDE